MIRSVLAGVAAPALLATAAGGQRAPVADSAWAAALAPVVRPLLADATVLAVGADTGRRAAPRSPERSRALAVALAAALGVPGPGAAALRPDALPACRTTPPSERRGRPLGETARVLWLPGQTARDAVVRVTFSCRLGTQRFDQGVIQRVAQQPDGTWRASGPPTHLIS